MAQMPRVMKYLIIYTPNIAVTDMKKPILNYISVFEENLEKQRKRIQNELGKQKSKRNKEYLKKELKEAKKAKKLIKEVKKNHTKQCPHCGSDL